MTCGRTLLVLVAVMFLSAAMECPSAAADRDPCFAQISYAERVARGDAIVVARCLSSLAASGDYRGTFEVTDVLYQVTAPEKSPRRPANWVDRGQRIAVDSAAPPRPGDLYVLTGPASEKSIAWGSPVAASSRTISYLRQLPEPTVPAVDRLRWFASSLNDADPLIAEDAFLEWHLAAPEDVLTCSRSLPVEPIRQAFVECPGPSPRWGLLGLMLGACGTAQDADRLERILRTDSPDFRLGIEGVLCGYLLLTGERGLAVIEETQFRRAEIVFHDAYALIRALRYLWRHDRTRIPISKLRAAAQTLLRSPDAADLVIDLLIELRDTEALERIARLYGADPFDSRLIKRQIVRYLVWASGETPVAARRKGFDPIPADHQSAARAQLADLTRRDPEFVRDTMSWLDLVDPPPK